MLSDHFIDDTTGPLPRDECIRDPDLRQVAPANARHPPIPIVLNRSLSCNRRVTAYAHIGSRLMGTRDCHSREEEAGIHFLGCG